MKWTIWWIERWVHGSLKLKRTLFQLLWRHFDRSIAKSTLPKNQKEVKAKKRTSFKDLTCRSTELSFFLDDFFHLYETTDVNGGPVRYWHVAPVRLKQYSRWAGLQHINLCRYKGMKLHKKALVWSDHLMSSSYWTSVKKHRSYFEKIKFGNGCIRRNWSWFDKRQIIRDHSHWFNKKKKSYGEQVIKR